MRTRTLVMNALVAVVAATTACDEGTIVDPPAEGLTAEDLAVVALDTDLLSGGIVFAQAWGAGMSAGVTTAQAAAEETVTREFSRSRECQAGGSIELQGTAVRTHDGAGTVEVTVTGTRSQVSCTRTREDRTLVIDGSGTFEAFRKRADGQPVGDQTTSYEGSFDWTKTRGEETRTGSCTYSLTSVRSPETMTVHVTGTVCDREIDRTREWSHGT